MASRIDTFLDKIPPEGISAWSLAAELPSWTEKTFESTLKRALEGNFVIRTAGGGGGVVKRTELATPEAGELQNRFMDELVRQAGESYAGVKSHDLRVALGVDEPTFKKARKALQEKNLMGAALFGQG